MIFWTKQPNPENEHDWPYDQSYMGNCYECKASFNGPKRAGICWKCYHPQGKDWWRNENTKKEQSE